MASPGPIRTVRSIPPLTKHGRFRPELFFLAAAFLCYLAVFIGCYSDVVFGSQTFAKRDIFRFYYPVWRFGADCLKQGVLPLWNPYNSFGTPFLADIQTCVLYPLTLFLYIPDYRLGFNFYILFHLALAGFFTCLWMRECGASKPASFLSGLAFSLGGYVLSTISLTISLATLVYFPLALFTLRRAFRSSGFFWKAACSLVLLVQYLAGDPAVFFATLVVFAFFTLYKTAEARHRSGRWQGAYLTTACTAVGIFAGLAAFHWPLFLEFLRNSTRSSLTFDHVTMWSLQYNDLVSLFFPYLSDLSLLFMDYWVRQSWMENGYAGLTVFFLAFFSLRGAGKKPIVGYHVLLALFGLALALGRFTWFYRLLYEGFPFFRFIRYPVRFLFLFHFALACLAGFGLDALLKRVSTARPDYAKARRPALLMLVIGILVLSTMYFSGDIESAVVRWANDLFGKSTRLPLTLEEMASMVVPVLSNVKRSAMLLSFLLLGALSVSYLRIRKSIATAFFILLVFTDLFESNAIEVRLPARLLETPGKNLSRVLQDPGLFRIMASPKTNDMQLEPKDYPTLEATFGVIMEALAPNLLLPHRVFDVTGYDSIFVNDGVAINNRRIALKSPGEQRFFDMLNIRYLVSPHERLGEPYKLVVDEKPFRLFLNERVLPRAYLVARAETVENRESILDKITSKEFEPDKVIYLESAPLVSAEAPFTAGAESVETDYVSPNKVLMRVESMREQWLFFSDLYYPGWRATLDGKPVPIYRANYAFRAVRVPQGRFNLEWNYDPILFKIGSIISLLTLLGVIAGLWRGRRRTIA